MRKMPIIFILLLLTVSLAAENDKKFAVRLTACGLWPADANYREIYGKSVLLPRLELAYNFSAKLSAWAGFSWLKKDGYGPESGIACNSAQRFLAAGAAYSTAISKSTTLRLAAGPLLVFYREKAGLSSASGNTLGADINATLAWAFSSNLALEGRLGYLLAADSIDGGKKFKMGGLWGGIGLAVNF
jgi:hypothetical protein